MQILEIINPTIKQGNYSGVFRDSNRNHDKDPGFLGSGNFSVVSQDRSDPHMVTKTARGTKETEIDGFWIYSQYILKYKLWENPYFPRIYAKKTFTDKTRKSINRAQIEKLTPPSDLNDSEIAFLYRKMFGEEVDPKKTNHNVHTLSTRVEEEVVSKSFKNKDKYDSSYVRAVTILHKIAGKHDLIIDIWGDNIMIRRGPHGVQLVITDPFSSSAK